MARYSRTETITHDLGEGGRLTLRTVSGDVRLRSVEGTVVKVLGSYDVHGRHEGSGKVPPEASPIMVRKAPGELEVEARNRVGGFFDALGEVVSRGGRTTVEWQVDLPRGASLRLHGVSADLSVDGVRGTQEYHTVSGDIAIRDVAGSISIHSVSGDASISEAQTISIDATSTSGNVDVRAERFGRFGFTTVSGDVELTGELEPGDGYRVETVTGDLQLTTPSGLEVEASGPAVSLRTDMPHRSDSGRGRKVAVVGDGAAHVRFRSMSGDVTISAPFGHRSEQPLRAADSAVRFAESIGNVAEMVGRKTEARIARRMEAVGRRLEASLSGPWGMDPDHPWTSDRGREDPGDRHGHGRDDDARDTRHAVDHPSRTPDTSAEATGTREPSETPGPSEPIDQMAVLRALERGEIDVAEAARLLSTEGARYG